jgi:hypothetical protein
MAVADVEHASLEGLDLGIEGAEFNGHNFKPWAGQTGVS